MTFKKSIKPGLKIRDGNVVAKLYAADGISVTVWSNESGHVQVDIHDHADNNEHFVVTAVPDEPQVVGVADVHAGTQNKMDGA